MTATGQRLPVAGPRAVRAAAWRIVAAEPGAVLLVLALDGLAAAAGLGPPWLLGLIVNRVQAGGGVSVVDGLLPAVLGFAVAQLLLVRFARYAGHRFGERALARLRERFVARVLALPSAVVEHAGAADLMSRSTGDVAAVGVALRDAVPDTLVSLVLVAVTVAAVFAQDPVLGACGLAGGPLLWLVARWYLARARTAYLAEAAAGTDVAQGLAATAAGARTVAALGLAHRRIAVGEATVAAGLAAQVRTLWLRTVLYTATDSSDALPVAVALLVGGLRYDAGAVSLGAVVACALYLTQLAGPLDTALERMEQLQTGGAALARLVGVDEAPAAREPDRRVPDSELIEVSGVGFAYRAGHPVLSDVDLVIEPGERLAIVGPSGAGKTTLARLLAGIDAPTLGRVTVGGVPVAGLAQLRRRIVLVTQEHHVFLGSLRENLAIAAPDAGDAALLAALATVQAGWVRELPAGLDTRLGAGGTALGAAQEQQLALARVLLADPHTVILDEATSLLDPVTARHTERSLAAVLAGRTVVAIAHRLQTARDADRIVVLRHGRVSEVGTHAELVGSGGEYARLWRAGAPPRSP